MAPIKTVEQYLKKIRTALRSRKNIDVIAESPKEAYIQGVLSRGDRRVSEVLYAAHQMGGSKAFKRAMKQAGLSPAFYLYRERPETEIFPWARLDMGLHQAYLYEELKRAEKLQPTIPCFDGCKRCGVC